MVASGSSQSDVASKCIWPKKGQHYHGILRAIFLELSQYRSCPLAPPWNQSSFERKRFQPKTWEEFASENYLRDIASYESRHVVNNGHFVTDGKALIVQIATSVPFSLIIT